VQNIERHGLELSTFLHYTGFRLEELELVNGRIAAHKHLKMLRYSDRLFPTDLSVFLDLKTALAAFPDLVALLGNCRNLGAAIDSYLYCKDILGEIDRIGFTKTASGFEIDYVDESRIEFSLSAFANFILLISVIRHYLPPNQFQLNVELTRPHFPAIASIEARIRSSLHFGRPRNRLTCITKGLATPYPVYNDLLNSYARQKVETQLQDIRDDQTFSSQVEELLRKAFYSGDPGLDSDSALQHVCRSLGVSRWTVLRKLKREGTLFKTLFSQVRYGEACQMLAQISSLREISTCLGFASQSAFSRFFKNHSGTTPSLYREAKRTQHG